MNRDSIQQQAWAAQARKPAGRKGSRPEGRLARILICWLSGLLACTALLAPLGAWAADSAAALEYKVKAGYLFNFAKFIEWPAGAFPSTNSPFVIGVLDGGEASPVLRSLLEGKQVNGRLVEVRSVFAETIGKEIHILLVTRAAGKTPEDLRKFVGSASILMVGETDEFAERGGTIGFVREEESVRLTLCLERATEAGLKVSSKLSSVARMVKTKRNK